MSSQQKRLEATVRGYVQGVGFRWYVRQVAQQLRLCGYVRNRPDRTVEVVAEGSEPTLLEFLRYLEAGPSGAVVDRVDARWLPGSGRHHGFEVRY